MLYLTERSKRVSPSTGMDEGIDSGPIISQETIAIKPSDTAKNLWDNFTIEGEKLFVNFLELWLSGNPIPSQTQDESLATYYPKAPS